MATSILVPVANAWRAESTLRSLGHSVRFESRNRPDLMKARATWVMGLIRASSLGITSCCLEKLLALVSRYVWVVDDGTHPVRYIRQMGSLSPATLLGMRPATNHTRAATVRSVKKCMAPDSSLSIHETNQLVRRRR